MMNFSPEYEFTKGIVYAEFFDIGTDNLVGFSEYVTDFGFNGTVNAGDIEGGVGNQLIMSIPDTARLEITAKTADAALNNMALPLGGTVHGGGIIETVMGVVATGTELTIENAAQPLGGSNGPVVYILTSSGADKAAVEANSGTAYKVENNIIQGFNAVSGNTYCVKYFTQVSSALQLDIPALFAPAVVRAHFAVNVYAKQSGDDAMASSLYKVRHYFIPRYFFTAGLQDSVGQTTPGSVDLSGKALTYKDAMQAGMCANSNAQSYGFIVDEFKGANGSTAAVDGIYFIGLGDGATVAANGTLALPVKYSVNGVLTDITDMSQVTFTSAAPGTASFEDEHSNVLNGSTAGSTTVTATVTNSANGVTYSDTIPVTVS